METIHGLSINGPAIIATAVVFTLLAVAAVALRFFAKRIAGSTYRWDDWLLLIALIIFVTTEVLVIISDVVGRKATSDTDPRYWVYFRLVYVYSIFYFVVIGLVELSILLLYRHVFYPTHLRHTSIVLAAVCIAWLIAALVIEIGYPGHKINAYFPGSSGVVFDVTYLSFWLAMGIIETLIEITILVLPLREILRLQISKQKKYLISCSLLLGGFVIITSIVRLAVLYRPGEIDIDLTQGDIWLNVHLGTAIISACLPTFRPLISRRSGSGQSYGSRKGSYTVNHSTVLSASRNRMHGATGSESREGIFLNPQSDIQGTFADARRTTSSDGSSTKWQDDGPVKSGEAIGVKKTVEVV
ncbi:MAG: hypothetical protein LQ339_005501 [Xanthoria mediterranea]|nr:MAG: hypothetical protein LQ339_005501 [Xanthoria mediterranea]